MRINGPAKRIRGGGVDAHNATPHGIVLCFRFVRHSTGGYLEHAS